MKEELDALIAGLRSRQRDAYVLNLLGIVVPKMEFSTTLMGFNNYIKGTFRTDDIFAMIHATPEQRAEAYRKAMEENPNSGG